MRLSFTLFAVTAMLVAAQAQVPSYVPTDDLVGWWPFNGNANDESGNGNDGTVNGATLASDRYNQANKAYTFDGTSSFLQLGPSAFAALDEMDGGDLTASFWFKPNSTGTLFMNFGWGVHTYFDGSSVVYGHVGIWPDNTWYYLNSEIINDPGTWHHIVIVKNGPNQEVYLNGTAPTTVASQPSSFGDQIYVGGNPMDNNGWFHGEMDDIGIWNRAISDAEVTGLFSGSGVGIEPESSTPSELSIYPNPTKGSFALLHSLSGKVNLHVFDIAGRLVYSEVFSVNGEKTWHRLDLSTLTKGPYSLVVGDDNGRVSQRVVIE